ncbi:Smr/MutS family protein [Bartonella sp. DGB1]|uniref:Smr/MutS family protein n=1 Tax=Bartonella sp. DGB1 TaxID=3239807 RepID=UPI00352572B1
MMNKIDKSKGGKKGSNYLTEEDLKIWQEFSKKIHTKPNYEIVDSITDKDYFADYVGKVKIIKKNNCLPVVPHKKLSDIKSKISNKNVSSTNISFNKKYLLKAGKKIKSWDAVFDAHNLTQEQVYELLLTFFEQAQKLKKYRILIITGKGNYQFGTGVLRQNVHRWLKTKKFDKYVANIDYNMPAHQGSFSVTLKPID